MTNQQTIDLWKKSVIPSYTPRLVLTKGKGAKVWDANGKVYLDFLAGISVVNVGHCHPHVVDAIKTQAETLMHVSNIFYNENQARLAEKLSGLSLRGKCFFCNSGAEANEALIKLARLRGHDKGRYEVISMRNSFHGRTLATAAATGQTKVQKGFEPMPEGFVLAEFNDLDSVKAAVNEKTAAVLVEAVQGEGGVVPAETDFMKGLRALCTEKDILLLCDEVQCGLGRTGHWFGYQASVVTPDAFSLAKSLGGGFPIGAIVTNQKVADVFQPGTHASTFGGTPLACAAALAVIQVIEVDRLVERAGILGASFMQDLEKLVDKYGHLKEVRGKGLMVGLELDQPARPLVDIMLEMGLIALDTAQNVVRFLPPLTLKESELEEAVDIIDEACEQWHSDLGDAPVAAAGASRAAGDEGTAPAADDHPAEGDEDDLSFPEEEEEEDLAIPDEESADQEG
ncbi:MAG: aspartate aminotransferase family protein [Kiritimatiellae bacterium]|nr:aspartate aminotransferase family protein [Kiritimatiellia bacterium]